MSEQNTTLRKVALVLRILLGLGFVLAGVNGLFQLSKLPPMTPAADAFMAALGVTGYMIPFIKGTEVLVGLLLLSNRFVPLALVVLTPILLNIVALHLFLNPKGLAIGIGLLVMHGFLVWYYRSSYTQLASARVE